MRYILHIMLLGVLISCSEMGFNNKCKITLNKAIFDKNVSDSYDIESVKIGMSYESLYNNKIRNEIVLLLENVEKIKLNDEEKIDLKKRIIDKIKYDIDSLKMLSINIKENKLFYGNQDPSEFISHNMILDLKDSVSIIRNNFDQLLNGSIKESFNTNEMNFFCPTNKNKFRLGNKSFNALFYSAITTLSVYYNKPIYKMKEIKINGADYIQSSSLSHLIKLPRNFNAEDIYQKFKNSTYFYTNSTSKRSSLLIFSPGYIGYNNIYEYNTNAKNMDLPYQYLPWFVNAFKLSNDIDVNFLLWSYRLYTKTDYIPSNFVNQLNTYDELTERFKPIKYTKLSKTIQSGQLILIADRKNKSTALEKVINGENLIVGIVMDYDYQGNYLTILTEYNNSANKIGLGYDVIDLNNQNEKRDIYLFKITDFNKEKNNPEQENKDTNVDKKSNLLTNILDEKS